MRPISRRHKHKVLDSDFAITIDIARQGRDSRNDAPSNGAFASPSLSWPETVSVRATNFQSQEKEILPLCSSS